ncbi:MAG: hypothetical protein ACPG5P_01395 [Saprospiraceae bacterium]
MKNLLFLGAFLLAFSFSYGQTVEQRQMMLKASPNSDIGKFAKDAKEKYEAKRKEIEEYARKNNIPIRTKDKEGRIIYLKGFRGAGKVPVYIIEYNTISAQSISTDEVHSGGSLGLSLDGAGFRIAEWDGGDVLTTHENFGGRATNHDSGSTSSHATHVAGTLIGDGSGNASARGMAPAALLDSWDFYDDDAEMISAATIAGER